MTVREAPQEGDEALHVEHHVRLVPAYERFGHPEQLKDVPRVGPDVDARAHLPEHLVLLVDVHLHIRDLGQRDGRSKAARPAAHDGDPQMCRRGLLDAVDGHDVAFVRCCATLRCGVDKNSGIYALDFLSSGDLEYHVYYIPIKEIHPTQMKSSDFHGCLLECGIAPRKACRQQAC